MWRNVHLVSTKQCAVWEKELHELTKNPRRWSAFGQKPISETNWMELLGTREFMKRFSKHMRFAKILRLWKVVEQIQGVELNKE